MFLVASERSVRSSAARSPERKVANLVPRKVPTCLLFGFLTPWKNHQCSEQWSTWKSPKDPFVDVTPCLSEQLKLCCKKLVMRRERSGSMLLEAKYRRSKLNCSCARASTVANGKSRRFLAQSKEQGRYVRSSWPYYERNKLRYDRNKGHRYERSDRTLRDCLDFVRLKNGTSGFPAIKKAVSGAPSILRRLELAIKRKEVCGPAKITIWLRLWISCSAQYIRKQVCEAAGYTIRLKSRKIHWAGFCASGTCAYTAPENGSIKALASCRGSLPVAPSSAPSSAFGGTRPAARSD